MPMTFEDLPHNWSDLPLTDPVLAADVVDLALGYWDRLRNSMLVLLCGEDMRVLQPCIIEGFDWRCTARERGETFRFLHDLPSQIPVHGVIIAISSRTQLPADVAGRWLRSATQELAKSGPSIMHFFSAAAEDQPRLVADAVPPGMAG